MRQSIIDIDYNILHQIAAGNTTAFSRIFHTHRDKLYSFVLSICGSPQEAEDIVQDVFLKVWTMRADLSGVRDFDSYLFRMSHNHCVNIIRRKVLETTALANVKVIPSISSTEDVIQFKETAHQVREAIDALPERQKEVFILSRDHGLNQEEISRQLNISVPTVKSHMTQAMRTLRTQFKNLSPARKSAMLIVLAKILS